MLIVIEGPDNSGKSTLAQYIYQWTGIPIQYSEGPEKYPGEIVERTMKYLSLSGNLIVDRHPCISQKIYGPFRGGSVIPTKLVDQFYSQDQLIIYCRGRGLADHVVKSHDTQSHLESVSVHHGEICSRYDAWAMKHAHLWYRVGDSKDRILTMVKGYVRG